MAGLLRVGVQGWASKGGLLCLGFYVLAFMARLL